MADYGIKTTLPGEVLSTDRRDYSLWSKYRLHKEKFNRSGTFSSSVTINGESYRHQSVYAKRSGRWYMAGGRQVGDIGEFYLEGGSLTFGQTPDDWESNEPFEWDLVAVSGGTDSYVAFYADELT